MAVLYKKFERRALESHKISGMLKDITEVTFQNGARKEIYGNLVVNVEEDGEEKVIYHRINITDLNKLLIKAGQDVLANFDIIEVEASVNAKLSKDKQYMNYKIFNVASIRVVERASSASKIETKLLD